MAEDDRVGVGEAPAQPREPAVGGAAVVGHDDPRALRLDDAHRGQPHRHLDVVDVAADGVDRRPERLQLREHRERDEIPGVEDRVGGAEPLDAGGRERARPARHVGVADDREPHPRHATLPRTRDP